jgi:hypothetical protein
MNVVADPSDPDTEAISVGFLPHPPASPHFMIEAVELLPGLVIQYTFVESTTTPQGEFCPDAIDIGVAQPESGHFQTDRFLSSVQ